MNVLPDSHTIANFPYLSQRDNRRNPSGSCNVTSIAMCLKYLGIVGNGEGQLEDQLYLRCEQMGFSRHDPLGLHDLVESFKGIKDDYTRSGTLEKIRISIAENRSVVLHGYFTPFGHILAVKGYDERGLIVNDPWGEYFADGYDTTANGEGLHYSWGLISRVCSPESVADPHHIFMHSIYRG